MDYNSRPAWRTQWSGLILVVFVFPALFIVIAKKLRENGDPTLLLLFLAIYLIFVLVILYKRYSWKYTISQETIESHHGIIGRTIKSIRVKDLRNVNLKQSLSQRIFGVGDLEFSSAGGTGVEVTFLGVTRPMEIKNDVQALQGEQ